MDRYFLFTIFLILISSVLAVYARRNKETDDEEETISADDFEILE